MTARFVRERRCVICEHRVHPVPDHRAPAFWNKRCDGGCECTTALCQPFRVFTDGTTDRSDKGPYEPSNQQPTQEQPAMTIPQQHTAPSADDFLLGGSLPSAKFASIGITVTGRITERPTVEQQRDFTTGDAKYWEDGKPQLQLVVTISTTLRDPEINDDDGTRRVYIKGQLKNAVAQAVRAAGAKGLEIGGVLSVTYARDGVAKNPRFNAPKEYTAHYTPAAAAELNTPDPGAAAAAPSPIPGLTPEQLAAALANPATAALLAQQQAAASAQPVATGGVPPF